MAILGQNGHFAGWAGWLEVGLSCTQHRFRHQPPPHCTCAPYIVHYATCAHHCTQTGGTNVPGKKSGGLGVNWNEKFRFCKMPFLHELRHILVHLAGCALVSVIWWNESSRFSFSMHFSICIWHREKWRMLYIIAPSNAYSFGGGDWHGLSYTICRDQDEQQ